MNHCIKAPTERVPVINIKKLHMAELLRDGNMREWIEERIGNILGDLRYAVRVLPVEGTNCFWADISEIPWEWSDLRRWLTKSLTREQIIHFRSEIDDSSGLPYFAHLFLVVPEKKTSVPGEYKPDYEIFENMDALILQLMKLRSESFKTGRKTYGQRAQRAFLLARLSALVLSRI